MRGRIDFKTLNTVAMSRFEGLVREWLPGGTRSGAEYAALNPTRADSKKGSFSINLNNGVWCDFATGDKGGDPVSLFAYLFHRNDQGAAARDLAQLLGVAPAPTAKPAASADEWLACLPPSHPPAPPAHFKRGAPDVMWCYRNAQGSPLGYIARFTTSEGGKEVLPVSWFKHATTGQQGWRWRAFPEPRWLYGLDRLAAHPEASVLLVEGEKCADAAQALLLDVAVVTWPGGSKAVDKVDWSPLAGRRVTIWPDCDALANKQGQILPEAEQPGMLAAQRILAHLSPLGCRVWLMTIPYPGAKPSGWDVADFIAEGATSDSLRAYVRHKARLVVEGRLMRRAG